MCPRKPFLVPSRQLGLTLLELSVAMTVALAALFTLLSTITGVSGVRAVERENAIAATAAINAIESMGEVPFGSVFALFNSDPADDPDGPGTAPGTRFAAPGLDVRTDSPDGLHGEILFPVVDDPLFGLQLREDLVDDSLGMPRDLSGDSIIDDRDHANDYFILPVVVRVRWLGRSGPREYELYSALCQVAKE